ncbi:DUF1345 domain-containing protein [Conyzicola sp.]|uniref:DUF1345 domain-containing protein n=1 Tax=Conyzicola sp. TaxID=1969404 RepID=UPI003988D625
MIRRHVTAARFAEMLAVGVLAGLAAGAAGWWEYAPTVGWAAAALTYSSRVWLHVGTFDAAATREHASREDPERAVTDVLILMISVASLFAVGFVLVQASMAHGAEQVARAALAVASVALSWILLHTLYALRYARLYYANSGGISFNQDEPPRYTDFAYLAFTLGMTYQVSDTNIGRSDIRRAALGHALLSFLFGSFVLATTINLIAGLSG